MELIIIVLVSLVIAIAGPAFFLRKTKEEMDCFSSQIDWYLRRMENRLDTKYVLLANRESNKGKEECVEFLKEELKNTDEMSKKIYCENKCVPNLAVERIREENECHNRAIADLKICFDEVIEYLENPESYINKKKVIMLQRKLSEKNKGEIL